MEPSHYLLLFLSLSAIVIVVFVVVGRSARTPCEFSYERAQRVRKYLLIVFTAALAGFLALSLPLLPYPEDGQTSDRIVHVQGRQYLFLVSDTPITPAEDMSAPPVFTPVAGIKVGQTVEFRVTSGDVTHGLGVYDSAHHLIAQTQAMPGYVNRLRVRFDEPGVYSLLCMELCGVAHHVMRGAINVEAATAAHAGR